MITIKDNRGMPVSLKTRFVVCPNCGGKGCTSCDNMRMVEAVDPLNNPRHVLDLYYKTQQAAWKGEV